MVEGRGGRGGSDWQRGHFMPDKANDSWDAAQPLELPLETAC